MSSRWVPNAAITKIIVIKSKMFLKIKKKIIKQLHGTNKILPADDSSTFCHRNAHLPPKLSVNDWVHFKESIDMQRYMTGKAQIIMKVKLSGQFYFNIIKLLICNNITENDQNILNAQYNFTNIEFTNVQISSFFDESKINMLHFVAEDFLFNLYLNFTVPIFRTLEKGKS
ncbi:hypothetical protein BpHYR1_052544 [Brachionus plicatilis]|uniref:Uncharacterized protein n=1 Tax=Brachionus plicatilis TaxID=10195 RepID=A0A3M7RXS3_BRAPC|nr:hypothetical protein BpHYR1_052544 [Brachionus plicatilis]